jgi:hypothetical protein
MDPQKSNNWRALKDAKELWVSGLSGGTIREINAVTLVFPVSSSLRHHVQYI